MKKILIFTLILVLSSIPVWAGERVMKFPSGTPVSVLSSTDISDDAYGTGWNGETTTAPSQNAVYDKIEAIYGGAEVNNLETVCTDIADTEILIGYAADSGSYYPLSGEVTMSNSGVVALADSVAVSSWNLTTPTITTSLTTDSKTISEAEIGILDGGIEGTEVLSTGEGGGSKYLREDGDGTCSWQAVAGSGSVTTMKEATVQVGGADIVSLDFGAGFDLTEDPDTEVNFTLDLSEIAAGGELGGNMDAPTIDDSIGVSSWTLTTSTLMDTALCYTDNDTPATAFILGLRKARDGDPTDDVSDEDYLGYVRFEGYHTDGYDEGAVIRAIVDNTPGNGDMPGRLEFLTSPDASATPAVRMTIKSTGYVGIGTTNPTQALDVVGTINATTITQGGTQVAISGGAYHDGFSDFLANEHIDWTGASAGTIHADNYIENVSTSLGIGTTSPTTMAITSDGGADDVTLTAANTSNAGLLSSAKFDEIVVNTAKVTESTTITTPDAEATAGVAITFAQAGTMAITEAADTITFTVTETDPNAILTNGSRSLSGDWDSGDFDISTLGNVGIGTTTPVSLLDVNSLFTVLSGGNVGIGTTDPTTALQVVGTITGDVTGALTGNASTVTNGIYTTSTWSGGELAGTGLAPTIADSVAVTSWNLTTPTITTSVDLPAGAINTATEIAADIITNTQILDADQRDTKCVTIETPADADDFLWFRCDTAYTVTSIDAICEAATSAIVVVNECDSAGDNCGAANTKLEESITADVDGQADDGTLGNPGVAAGNWLRLQVGTVTGTVGHVTTCVTYNYDD